jgi:hypothetical protein
MCANRQDPAVPPKHHYVVEYEFEGKTVKEKVAVDSLAPGEVPELPSGRPVVIDQVVAEPGASDGQALGRFDPSAIRQL